MTTWTTREAAEKCGLRSTRCGGTSGSGCCNESNAVRDGRRRFSDDDLNWLILLSKLRATGMPVRDMQRYAELVRSGAGERERLELLQRHRASVRAGDRRDARNACTCSTTRSSIYRRTLRAADKEN